MRKRKKKTFVVIGLGRFGSNIAKTLSAKNFDVLAIDVNNESVSAISREVPHCLIADASKFNVLKDLGVASIDHAVVAIGNNLQASILTVMNLKKLGVKNITVRCDEEGHREVYEALGATEILIPEEASAVSLANQIMSDTVLDYYEVAKGYAMVQLQIGPNFEPKTLIDLNVRNKFDVNIVGLVTDDGGFYIPKGTDILRPEDVIVVVGKDDKITKFDQFLSK